MNWLIKPKNESNILLFHHRFPTSTINVRRAAHPFTTKKYFGKTEYVLIHNGVISNANEMFVKHQELGIEYQSLLDDMTFNDSEALLWEVALTLEGKQKEVEAYGRVAFIALKLEKGKLTKMYFGRNSSPLNLLRDDKGITLSSEGEGESIKTDTLYTWNYALKRLTHREFNLPQWKPYVRGEYAMTNYTGACGYQPQEYPRQYWDDEYQKWIKADDTESNWQRLRNKFSPAPDYSGMYLIDSIEVENKKLEYILEARGNFEKAYWKAEYDYQDAEELSETSFDMYDVELLEKVLSAITSDPEYVDKNSVSSQWSELWAN